TKSVSCASTVAVHSLFFFFFFFSHKHSSYSILNIPGGYPSNNNTVLGAFILYCILSRRRPSSIYYDTQASPEDSAYTIFTHTRQSRIIIAQNEDSSKHHHSRTVSICTAHRERTMPP